MTAEIAGINRGLTKSEYSTVVFKILDPNIDSFAVLKYIS